MSPVAVVVVGGAGVVDARADPLLAECVGQLVTTEAGVVTADGLVNARRYAVLGIFTAAAILTPPDAISMIIMALPTWALYEASILAVRRVEKLAPKS